MTSTHSSAFERPRSTAEQAVHQLRFGFGRKLPLIMQADPAESGLACLAMVAGYHGHLTDLADLRTRFALSLKGMTAKTVVEIGEALHLKAEPQRADHRQLAGLKLPCILHWDMSHFVVLKRVLPKGRGIVIHDPEVGEVRVRRSEMARRFNNITALEFTPTAHFKVQGSPRPAGLAWLTGRVDGLKGVLMQAALLAVALQAFALATPLFMQWVVDNGMVTGDRELMRRLALGCLLLLGVQAAIGLMRSWVVLYMVSHFKLQWLTNAYTHLLRLPASYFDKRSLGELSSRFQSIHAIQHTLQAGFVENLLDGALAFTTLIVMALYSVELALVVGAAAGLYALLRWACWRPQRRATEQQFVLEGKEQALFLESVQNMSSIKLFNHEQRQRTRWLDAVVDATNRLLTAQKFSLGLSTARTLFIGVETVLVLWWGAGLVMDQLMTLGMLFAFIAYKATFAQRCYAFIDQWVELQMLRLRGDRMADVVLARAEKTVGRSASRRKPLAPDATLEVRDLWFRYADDQPWVLRGVNLSFKAGEAAAIVGASGSGKSTLIKVMLGLLPPTRGQVLYGGEPIEQLGHRAYRKLIGAVLQEDQLMAGSVLENICFFSDRPNMERVRQCAAAAAVHEDVEHMPLGYHTRVGGMGAALSSGQKQRILLARALYRKPRLLLLDEATSHVDAKGENLINEALLDMPITRIMVAHRAKAIRGVPRVIVIEHGTVAKDLASVIVTVTDAVAVNDEAAAPPPVLGNVLSLR